MSNLETLPRKDPASFEHAVADGYRFLMGPRGIVVAALFFCLGVWNIIRANALPGLVLLAAAIGIAPNEYGRPIPTPRIRKRTEAEDTRALSQGYVFHRTLPGWWLWGSLVAVFSGLALMVRWTVAPEQSPRFALVGLALSILLLVASQEIRLVVYGDVSRFHIAGRFRRLNLLDHVVPYRDLARCELVPRPWWFQLGMLWISEDSVWNLTPSLVVAIATKGGKRYLVPAEDPVALCRLLHDACGLAGR